jgi:hypothetical protein
VYDHTSCTLKSVWQFEVAILSCFGLQHVDASLVLLESIAT